MSEPSPTAKQNEPSQGGKEVVHLHRLTADVREELVAYLDGELSEERQQEIDRVLASNASARRDVARLSEVYELLDLLPESETPEDFTQSTLAMLAEESQSEEAPLGKSAGWLPALLAVLPAAAAAAVLTFAVAGLTFVLRDRTAEKVAGDLPVLERLDELRAVGNRPFLDWLTQESVRRQLRETTL